MHRARQRLRERAARLSLVLAVLGLAACSDLVDSGAVGEVAGFELVDSRGDLVASGQVGGRVDGRIVLAPGESLPLRVVLISRAGNPIAGPAGASVHVTTLSPAVAQWTPTSDREGVLVAKATGGASTALRVDVLVGGKSLFERPPFVDVVVAS